MNSLSNVFIQSCFDHWNKDSARDIHSLTRIDLNSVVGNVPEINAECLFLIQCILHCI